MIIMQANNVKKSYGDRQVLDGVSLSIGERERIGLVGVNGSGKSTLLKCLAGEMLPDAGEITAAGFLSIGYLEQLPGLSPGVTVWEAMMDSFSSLLSLRAEMRRLEEAMANGEGDLDRTMARYARVLEEYEQANGYACETMARRILSGLGFGSEEFSQPLATMSGGELTRLNLGRLLAANPGLLLLDEPTNHLDMSAIEWLEGYLSSYSGSVLVVSHDRMFLDRIATRIVELRGGNLESFAGNYTAYMQQRVKRDEEMHRAFARQQEYIKKTEEFIRRYNAGVKARQARGRQSQLERLQLLQDVRQDRAISARNIRMDHESGGEVLKLVDVCVGAGGRELVKGISLTINKGEKVALVGPNGSGKTTLIRTIVGQVSPLGGQLKWGSRVKWAYFSQHNEELDPAASALDQIVYTTGLTIEEARGALAQMLFFGDDVYKRVADLSGGERARLSLLKLILSGANFLILDEPTNHLDIDSRQAVETMLADYPGSLLVVSHDRYFLDQVVNRVLAIDDGVLASYPGNYSDYHDKMRERRDEMQAERRRQEAERTPGRKGQGSDPRREMEKKHRQLALQIQQTEENIAELEARKDEVLQVLADPDTYLDQEKSREATQRLAFITDELERVLAEWERLLGLQEEVESGMQ